MHYIAWMFWSRRGGPSQRWSKMHILQEGTRHKTLCNLIVPSAFTYNYDELGDFCLRCQKKKNDPNGEIA